MDEGFAECVAGLEQMADAGNNTEESELTPTTATLGLVQDFQANILIDPSNPEEAFTVDLGGIDDVANFEQVDLVDTFHISSSPPRRNEFGSVEISFDETGKPRCTYTDLIEKALSENGGLTVSEIYQWISDHFPYFQPDDDRWKNSVRHNLSINPYFSKGEKARSGAGHLWTISEESRALRPALRKKDFEYEDLAMCIENDTDRAVANILGQYHLAKNNMEGKPTRPNKNHESDSLCTPPPPQPPKHVQLPSGNDTGGTANDEFMEVSPVVIEYESNGFPGTEYTIDLSQFQFPDASGLSFDDLMPGGLIVIQTDDQDANKENVDHVRSVDAMGTEYLMTQQLDYSAIRHESSHITETERVSGQLISEAMTHDFDMHKDKCELNSIHQLEQSNCAEEEQHQVMREEQDNQQQNEISPSENTQEYLTLDSIDQLALQEVIHGNSNSETSIHHYQMMNVADYEPNKDIIGGYCTFAT
ncbi:uncharacterized protein LOC118435120 isoform X1 [Folsomia candida]|uniref:uncharacterized protein LOC118435120 isoform X1 n=1 Tax=Folsomia candida TaxID=158441 RepID=UPI001604AAFA|nr:uncharacterized protein LOC118435120 isoform X1 [Folsomia candida]